MDVNKLGDIVRRHRKKAQLTQSELARLAGVGKTAVFDIEHGKMSIRLTTLQNIFHVLNIQLRLESPLLAEEEAVGREGASP